MRIIVLIACAFLLGAFFWSALVQADSWFDEYGKLPWAEERLRLDNFGRFLQKKSEFHGFIACYRGRDESRESFNRRVAKVERYLRDRFALKSDRLSVVLRKNAGQRWTILQPVEKGADDPIFPSQ